MIDVVRGAGEDGSVDPTGLLEVDGLVVNYPVRRSFAQRLVRAPRRLVHAVDGVSLSIGPGEFLALVGESGCGKTTMAQSITRMVDVAGGSIRLGGIDLTALSQRRLKPLRRRMQPVYQDPYESLDPRFRVRQTIEEPMLVHGIGSSRRDRRTRALDALEFVGLSPPQLYIDRFPHELSGGQRQRVAIAAALVLSPDLLLADEPVSMLDVSVRADILALLDRLRRERDMGILMITHDLSTAAQFADRIAVMYLGRIVEEGPARTIVRQPQHPYTRALLSVVPQRDPLERMEAEILRGEPPDAVEIPPGCRFHLRCPVAEDRCRTTDPSLRPVTGEEGSEHQAACLLV